jgi:predicted DNA-binding transcriptional regulator AlpA
MVKPGSPRADHLSALVPGPDDAPIVGLDACERHQPLAVSGTDAARLAGVSRSTWFRLVASGRAPRGLYLGSKRLWTVAELERWLAAGAPPAERWEAMQGGGAR